MCFIYIVYLCYDNFIITSNQQMDKSKMKSQNKNLSMTELLTALTHAQMEREASLNEFKRVSEKEKKRAETAQTQLQSLEEELIKTKENAEGIT